MTFDDAILRELNQRAEALASSLAAGGAKDFSEYKYMVGELRGLSLAINTVKDLAANLRESDD